MATTDKEVAAGEKPVATQEHSREVFRKHAEGEERGPLKGPRSMTFFTYLVAVKRFTNGRSDAETVADLYRKTFDSAVG